MVFNATFKNITVICGSQFYWWRKPEDLEKTTESGLSHTITIGNHPRTIQTRFINFVSILFRPFSFLTSTDFLIIWLPNLCHMWQSVLLVEETRGPGENHRPVACQEWNLSYCFKSDIFCTRYY
jgi:hypothetical protein